MSDIQASLLRNAEERAVQLFELVLANDVLRAGVDEQQASDAVRDLAREHFGVQAFWHKRIVRSGRNTLLPYRENPPVLTLQDDDICFLDFGPVFDGWEADYGRTYVLGSDQTKLRIRDEVERIWDRGREHFEATPNITGAGLYAFMVEETRAAGYEPAEVRHFGHLVGEFPHERIEDDRVTAYICADNALPLRRDRPDGQPWHWILEVHAADPARGFGAFFEQLLTC